MSAVLPSDEVAEDYKNALDDLVSNDRYQIANLTMIAKENIEHAEAISRVLTNHISRTSPSRKLPALYVLDSLVKNIGSPYTVYFGRNLHSTFMLAYSQVDAGIRRKMEEVLRTWREPIPGSLSTTPVFPIQSTQAIVDTLNKYRASAAPTASRISMPPSQHVRPLSAQAYRNTPTPPQTHLMNMPMNSSVSTTPVPEYRSSTAFIPHYGTPVPHSQPSLSMTAQNNASNMINLSELHANIDDLTTDAKIECATHPMDSTAQRKLATLQTLKELLDTGATSEQDLVDIRNTIKQEMDKKAAVAARPVIPPPTMPGPNLYAAQPLSQQQPPPSIPALSFVNQANLADLIRATANAHPAPQPQPIYPPSYHAQQHQAYNMQPSSQGGGGEFPKQVSSSIPASALPLLARLRASGFLSQTPGSTPAGIPASLPSLGSGPGLTAQLSSAALRIPRPLTVTSFLDQRPNQCSTCGRRFTSDDIGKEKKSRHLDWHFKTKARMLEAEKRGQNRSWYIDEREWISSKEIEDDADIDNSISSNAAQTSAEKAKKQVYVRAPTDPALRNAPCPIDQEPFKSEWSEEVQDFIWKDAIRVGQRYYHASCYREATKDRGPKESTSAPNANGAVRTTTPDSVLGKRKAEAIGESQQQSAADSVWQQHSLDGNAASKVKLES